MIFRILAVLLLALGLSACSVGNNVVNTLFGPKDDNPPVILEPEDGWGSEYDYRGPVAQVTKLTIERGSGGYIIRAVGLPPRQGFWDAELVSDNFETPVDGVMTYTFMIAPPPWRTAQGAPVTREVTVAHFVSDQRLGDARRIAVVGSGNTLTARR